MHLNPSTKLSFFTALLLLTFSINLHAQCTISAGPDKTIVCGEKLQLQLRANWSLLNTGSTENLRSLIFVTPQTGFACGANGTILKLTNGGDSIQSIITPTNNNLEKLYALNADTLFAVGHYATLLRSLNKGVTWDSIYTNIGPAESFTSIHFINQHVGFITASNGILLKTTNSGTTWTQQTTGISNYLYDIYFTNSLIGYLGGNNFLAKTTDGGNTWSKIGDSTSYFNYTQIIFINDSTGFVGGGAGGGFVLRTNNAGLTWDIVLSDNNYLKIAVTPSGEIMAYGKGVWLSSDNGNTWLKQITASDAEFNNTLTFYGGSLGNQTGGITVGANGSMYRKNNIDSISWSTQIGLSDSTIANPFVYPNVTTNYYVTAKVGNCIASTNITINASPLNLNSKDNYILNCGDSIQFNIQSNVQNSSFYKYNWTPSQYLSNDTILNPISKPTSKIKYQLTITSSDNECVDTLNINVSLGFDFSVNNLVALNCGDTLKLNIDTNRWNIEEQVTNFAISQIQLLSKDAGYIAGGRNLLKTIDGGKTWSSNLISGDRFISRIHFINELVGYVTCNNFTTPEILKTTNGGASWTIQNLQSYVTSWGNSLQFLNAQTGFALGTSDGATTSKILKTNNGGASWTAITSPYFITSFQFTTADTGFMTAYSGTNRVFKTTNGGVSWNPIGQNITDYISNIYFANNNLGFVIGGEGKIWKTNDAGNTWKKTEITLPELHVANIQSMHFYDSKNGIMVGGYRTSLSAVNYSGCIFNTTDGGDTWVKSNTQLSKELNGVYTDPSGFAIAVGTNGVVGIKLKSPKSFSWSPSTDLSNTNAAAPFAYPTSNKLYTVQASDGNCTITDTVMVNVLPLRFDLDPIIPVVCGDSIQIKTNNIYMYLDASRYNTSWQIIDKNNLVVMSSKPDSITQGNFFFAQGEYKLKIKPFVIPPPLEIRILPINSDSISETIYFTSDTIIERTFTVRDFSNYTFNIQPQPGRISPSSIPLKYQVSMLSPRGCSANDSVIIDPKKLVVNAGFNKTITCGETIALDTIKTNSNTSNISSIQWSNDTLLNDKFSYSPLASPIVNTDFTVTLITDNGCFATDTTSVLVVPLNVETNDTFLFCNESAQLNLTTNYSGTQDLTYRWSPPINIDSVNIKQPKISAIGSRTYTVELTTWNGCKASDSMQLNLAKSSPPQLCIVNVTDNNLNQIVWDRSQRGILDSFFIMKETNVTNQYMNIGKISASQEYIFTDSLSNPFVQSNKYKLMATDQCGISTDEGPSHQTMHLSINKGVGNTWNLLWNKYEGFIVNTYNIYRGSQINNLSLIGSSSGSNNAYTDLNPTEGDVYYQVEIVSPNACNPNKNFNTSRSNKASNKPLGILNEGLRKPLVVYPNPVSSILHVQLPQFNKSSQLNICDMQGKCIETTFIAGQEAAINIAHLNAGIYLVKLIQDNQVTYTYVIKQ